MDFYTFMQTVERIHRATILLAEATAKVEELRLELKKIGDECPKAMELYEQIADQVKFEPMPPAAESLFGATQCFDKSTVDAVSPDYEKVEPDPDRRRPGETVTAAILRFLSDHPSISYRTKEISVEVGLDYQTIGSYMTQLKRMRRVEHDQKTSTWSIASPKTGDDAGRTVIVGEVEKGPICVDTPKEELPRSDETVDATGYTNIPITGYTTPKPDIIPPHGELQNNVDVITLCEKVLELLKTKNEPIPEVVIASSLGIRLVDLDAALKLLKQDKEISFVKNGVVIKTKTDEIPIRERIVSALRQKAPTSAFQVAKKIEESKRHTEETLIQMVREGLVTRVGIDMYDLPKTIVGGQS